MTSMVTLSMLRNIDHMSSVEAEIGRIMEQLESLKRQQITAEALSVSSQSVPSECDEQLKISAASSSSDHFPSFVDIEAASACSEGPLNESDCIVHPRLLEADEVLRIAVNTIHALDNKGATALLLHQLIAGLPPVPFPT